MSTPLPPTIVSLPPRPDSVSAPEPPCRRVVALGAAERQAHAPVLLQHDVEVVVTVDVAGVRHGGVDGAGVEQRAAGGGNSIAVGNGRVGVDERHAVARVVGARDGVVVDGDRARAEGEHGGTEAVAHGPGDAHAGDRRCRSRWRRCRPRRRSCRSGCRSGPARRDPHRRSRCRGYRRSGSGRGRRCRSSGTGRSASSAR